MAMFAEQLFFFLISTPIFSFECLNLGFLIFHLNLQPIECITGEEMKTKAHFEQVGFSRFVVNSSLNLLPSSAGCNP